MILFKKIKSIILRNDHFRTILIGSSTAFIFKIFGMAFGYLLIFLIAKIYGSEVIGIYSVTTSIILIASMIGSMGVNTSILRYAGQFQDAANQKNLKNLYKYGLEIAIIASSFIGIIIYFLSNIIAEQLFEDALYINALKFSAIIIPFMATLNISLQFLVGIKEFKRSEILRSTLSPLIVIIILLFFNKIFLDSLLPVYSLGLCIIISSIYAIFFIQYYFKKLSIQKILDTSNYSLKKIELIKTSFPMMITAASALFLSNISILMCEIFLESKEVGIFSVCWRIAAIVPIVMLAFNSMSGPKFAELYWKKKYVDLQDTITKSTSLVFYISFIIALLIIAFSKQILGMFGQELINSVEVLVYLILGQMVYCCTSANGIFLNMIGKQKLFAWIVFITLLVNILFNIYLIPSYGIKGAAIGNLVGSLVLNISTAIIIKNKFNFKTYFIPGSLNFIKSAK